MKPRTAKISISGTSVETTPVFESFWKFAAERQSIFFRRLRGTNHSALTEDDVLQAYKFTNSYRASDRVSQFLIREVIYEEDVPSDPENQFFRIMLFKLFNKIETWQLLLHEFGPINLESYSFEHFDQALTSAMERGTRIYSPAYIMPSAGRKFGCRYKHQNHLKLIEYMIQEEFPERLANARSMKEAFDLMVSAPSIGPFLAYQFVTDLNYSSLMNFSEMEFVKAGPGALDGISKCFVGGEKLDPEATISYMADHQEFWFDAYGIDFPSLFGRPLQLIDCQNLFCEISKYARAAFPDVSGISGRTRIKQKYASSRTLPTPWYPPKWGINDRVNVEFSRETQSFEGAQQASAVQYTLL